MNEKIILRYLNSLFSVLGLPFLLFGILITATQEIYYAGLPILEGKAAVRLGFFLVGVGIVSIIRNIYDLIRRIRNHGRKI